MATVLLLGGTGLVGSALVEKLKSLRELKLDAPNRSVLDCSNRKNVFDYIHSTKPEVVIIAAARVGGIGANIADPISFLIENLEIQNNVMLASQSARVSTILFIGSSCIYPAGIDFPISEEMLMTGPLEKTNRSYALAKIAGIQLAQSIHEKHGVRVLLPMPCNIYGPGDHFDFDRAHVASSLVRRFVDAVNLGLDKVTLWGDGTPRREFMHSHDLADACMFLLENWQSSEIINVGSGVDISIRELASLVAEESGFSGKVDWDTSKPNGVPRKLLDTRRITELGWTPRISIELGIRQLIEEYSSLATMDSAQK